MANKVVLLIAALLLAAPFALSAGSTAEQASTTEGPAVAAGKYHEAPMLAELVASGELPPVDERLPDEPLVVTPLEGIGKYGGVIRMTHMGPQHFGPFNYYLYETLVRYTPDMQEIIPNIAQQLDVSGDAKSVTIQLRKGMQWSDGEPFTTNDFMFWYQDIALNKEILSSPPGRIVNNGEVGLFEALDDHTLRISFNAPYSVIVEALNRMKWDGGRGAISPYAPAHYLKQFHTSYTSKDKVEAIVKAEGFDTWRDFWFTKHNLFNNPDIPTLLPWKAVNTVNEPIHRYRRNAYYYKVDPAGNQLPYIDGWDRTLVTAAEGELLKVLSGDTDAMQAARVGRLSNYTVLMENRDKGNYRLVPYLWPPNTSTLFFNFSHDDPVLRELFNDQRFRVALSHGMNRSEINQLMSKGLAGEVSQPAPPDGPPYHGESELFRRYVEYSPEKANELLDELNLTQRDGGGYRLRSDGERLRMQMMYRSGFPAWVGPAVELFRKYYRELGMEIVAKPVDVKLLNAKWDAAEFDLIIGGMMVGGKPVEPVTRVDFVPIGRFLPGQEWQKWFTTNGQEGDAPPDAVKQLLEIRKQVFSETDPGKRADLTMQAYEIHADNLWAIGVLSDPMLGNFMIFSNNMRNVYDPMPIETSNGLRETWYFE